MQTELTKSGFEVQIHGCSSVDSQAFIKITGETLRSLSEQIFSAPGTYQVFLDDAVGLGS